MLIVTLGLVYETHQNQYFKFLSIPAGNRLIASGGYKSAAFRKAKISTKTRIKQLGVAVVVDYHPTLHAHEPNLTRDVGRYRSYFPTVEFISLA